MCDIYFNEDKQEYAFDYPSLKFITSYVNGDWFDFQRIWRGDK